MNELTKRERARTERNNARKLLGIQVEEVEPGRAVLSMPAQEHILQSSGVVHGGFLSLLADSAISTALRSVLDEDAAITTVELNINFLRPARAGMITGCGTLVHQGRTLAVGTAEIKDESGRLLACGRATFFIKKKNE